VNLNVAAAERAAFRRATVNGNGELFLGGGVVFRRSLFPNGNIQFCGNNVSEAMLVCEVGGIGRFNGFDLLPRGTCVVRKRDCQFSIRFKDSLALFDVAERSAIMNGFAK